MIFRKTSSTPATPEPEAAPAHPGSKGRPTRSRREAQAARRRPLVPADRKEARRRAAERGREARVLEQRAMSTGDERHMPAAHRGADRRFVRDFVDTRWNLAELFWYPAIVLIVLTFILPLVAPATAQAMSGILVIMMWGGIVLVAIDCFVLRARLRRALTERFGGVGQGLVAYGIMRALQFRRLRLPKPMVKHGEGIRD